jgi:hypothetical protein
MPITYCIVYATLLILLTRHTLLAVRIPVGKAACRWLLRCGNARGDYPAQISIVQDGAARFLPTTGSSSSGGDSSTTTSITTATTTAATTDLRRRRRRRIVTTTTITTTSYDDRYHHYHCAAASSVVERT